MGYISKDEMNEAFLNVRKAYRLLFDYQTRLLSLVKYIGGYYSYSYKGGWPRYCDVTPRLGKGTLDNWAWDWLNMYAYAFRFNAKEIEGKRVDFKIRIYSDTGFFDSRQEGKDKIDTNTYVDVEKSRTKVVLIAGNFDDPSKLLEDFTSEKSDYIDEGNKVNAKSYDLLEFYNEEETNKALSSFTDFCKKNGIKINL